MSLLPLSRDRVVKVADSLPSAPRILTELQQLLADTETDLGLVTALLRRDGGLTSRIIRIANGVVYGRGEPVGSLEDALARVGFSEVYRLASMAAMLQLADLPMRVYPISPKLLREHALLCALLMEETAGSIGLDVRTAYTAGLLGSVGRIALDVTAQKDFSGRRPEPLGSERLGDWEQGFFGLTSCDAGYSVLKAWRFQADVFVAVRDQFLHSLSVDALPMAKLLHLALGAAEESGYALPGCRAYLNERQESVLCDLRLDEAERAEATGRAMYKFERMKELLG